MHFSNLKSVLFLYALRAEKTKTIAIKIFERIITKMKAIQRKKHAKMEHRD